MDGTQSPHIHLDAAKGTDPLVAAMMAQSGGMGGQNGLWPILLLLLLGRGGLGGLGTAGAATGLAEASTIASITSAKDAVTATNAAKDALMNNIDALSKQCCCSTGEILQAINALTPQMFQSFATLTQGMTAGFSAAAMQACQNQAATVAAITNTERTLESQGDRNAAAQALAICQTQNQIAAGNAAITNQLNMQTCEIKQAIATDGAATRALIQANESARLREELADAKAALSNCQQTGNFSTILNAVENSQTAQILAAIAAKNCCSNGNGNSVK